MLARQAPPQPAALHTAASAVQFQLHIYNLTHSTTVPHVANTHANKNTMLLTARGDSSAVSGPTALSQPAHCEKMTLARQAPQRPAALLATMNNTV
jgi:hypothetical protein